MGGECAKDGSGRKFGETHGEHSVIFGDGVFNGGNGKHVV